MATANPFNSRRTLAAGGERYTYFALGALAEQKVGHVGRLPFSIRVLLESMLRNVDGFVVTADNVAGLANWNAKKPAQVELPFMPGRVVLQDFTGVPCVVDLAAMRDAMKALGGDPNAINPLVGCDLVIDHSVQVDSFGNKVALSINNDKEFGRNRERYEFLKWGQQSLRNFRCVPPATGIVHQVNLEYLSPGTLVKTVADRSSGSESRTTQVAYPDSCVGTDSHTTMINGMGVVGWGVGGIEAEAVMLGQPYYMVTPEVIGVRLTGKLPEGSTATDLVLAVTQMLRKKGVVEKFVEFCGPGVAWLSVPDRATIANMAPEYGATMGFFPVDAKTIDFLRFTGRPKQADLTEAYAKANGFWWDAGQAIPEFTELLEMDLGTIQPALAGPKRPQDLVLLRELQRDFKQALIAPVGNQSFGLSFDKVAATGTVRHSASNPSVQSAAFVGKTSTIGHGAVVIAAITSCTNTSNPDVMIAAGLVARKARQFGLMSKPWVKTSLAPGSKVVTEYFDRAGLSEDLDALGFQTVGYGCTTCIGNSGPLPEEVERAIKDGDLIAASVLSGNRNFEGRVHPAVKANYLASPPLVVAYAIAGTVDIDLYTDPIGTAPDGRPVYLRDIWPSHAEVTAVKQACLTPQQFEKEYGNVFNGNAMWNAVPVSKSDQYRWNDASTYIQNPPYFEGLTAEGGGSGGTIRGARVLVHVGDSVTTDHISPAGDIAEASPAGQYLKSLGVAKHDFNSYGSRRGNDRVMTRGTFANVRVKNILAEENGKIREGWWTRDFTASGAGRIATIYDTSLAYKRAGTPLIVVAGKDYGMGSSRDWAAKGTMLLGVKAVIAESFERIHRSNLVGMGVLPLTFKAGEDLETLGVSGTDEFEIEVGTRHAERGGTQETCQGERGGTQETCQGERGGTQETCQGERGGTQETRHAERGGTQEEEIVPRGDVRVTATGTEGARKGQKKTFTVTCRLDTAVEINYYRNGGILQTVLRKLLRESGAGVGV